MRAGEAGGGWEKDGTVVSTLGRTPHHEFRHALCPSAKARTGLALFDSLTDAAAGLAAPCLLLRALPQMCRFCGWPDKGMFSVSFPRGEPLHLLTSSELPSSLPMKFQNPAVELQFNNTTLRDISTRAWSTHSEVLQP